MKTALALVVFCAVFVIGCSNKEKEEELQRQLSLAQHEQATIQGEVAERDAYFEEVMKAVNEAYVNLERARAKEAQVMKQEGVEGPVRFSNTETRQQLLQNISDIGDALKENRKTISNLQSKAKSTHSQLASLNSLIDNMKKSLEEREQSIALLETRVKGLEGEVEEKTQAIAVKDMTIDQQQRKLNTAYYIVGTRDELEKKGVITDEGGFPWGLFGSTTIMASGIDPTLFTSIDKTKDNTIHVGGEVDEILPPRSSNTFAMAQPGENSSELTIVSPDKFWQDNYLVIIID
jgi:uncharacterized phage infection (PIP) family protein YhgE